MYLVTKYSVTACLSLTSYLSELKHCEKYQQQELETSSNIKLPVIFSSFHFPQFSVLRLRMINLRQILSVR